MIEKERGASPDQAAPQANNNPNSTAPEAVFHPLTWRCKNTSGSLAEGGPRARTAAIGCGRGKA